MYDQISAATYQLLLIYAMGIIDNIILEPNSQTILWCHTTLFTQNTMQKMHNCIDADITLNKSNGPTNHVLGSLKLYICQY